jgi:hypothetical protein
MKLAIGAIVFGVALAVSGLSVLNWRWHVLSLAGFVAFQLGKSEKGKEF